MQFEHFLAPILQQKAIELSLAHDEEVVCRNATVIVNKNGDISWVDNNTPLTFVEED